MGCPVQSWELDSMILMGPFQFSTFCDSTETKKMRTYDICCYRQLPSAQLLHLPVYNNTVTLETPRSLATLPTLDMELLEEDWRLVWRAATEFQPRNTHMELNELPHNSKDFSSLKTFQITC